ncbi:triphosphoribosyl-dephospho-CoA synthetase [bacterium]|nr:triphosphoribosyl-dephospho-CoA synthetase [bacterium]
MSDPPRNSSDLAEQIRRACLLEATARKAGNVHPGAAFEHLSYDDFVRSAEACAPVIATASQNGVGASILEAVRATKTCCAHNTNLGIILLLTPLAAVPPGVPLADGIGPVLANLTDDDTAAVYEAIRLAAPRGLGSSDEADVTAGAPGSSLLAAMNLAAGHDQVAAQYVTDFRLVLWFGVPLLERSEDFGSRWEEAIVRLQLELMGRCPDTDINRKCGPLDAEESARRAQAVLNARWPLSTEGRFRFREFDRWLRARESLRNPGTTADLITACLFAALRDDLIAPPDGAAIDNHILRIIDNTASDVGTFHS